MHPDLITAPDNVLGVEALRDGLRVQRWNKLVARRAIHTDTSHPAYVRVLHSTKGWRYISKRRLDLA